MSDFKKKPKPSTPANKPKTPAKQPSTGSSKSLGSHIQPSTGGKSIGSRVQSSSGVGATPAKPSLKSTISSGPRPPAGAGRIQPASISAAAPANLTQEMTEQLSSLDSRLETLQSQLGFEEHYDAMSDLDNGISALSSTVADCRRRGYCYQGFLERKVETLESKWQDARPRLVNEMEQSGTELQGLLNTAAQTRNNVRNSAAIPAFDRSLNALDARRESADTAFRSHYSGIYETFHQTRAQVELINDMLDELDMASFSLLAGESPVRSVKARWWRDGEKRGPDGVLYLTDQRLVFEQKEEVATKKVLFVATEKETVRQLVFETPLGTVQNVKSSSRGLMGHEDHLDYEFGSGAPYPNAHFHIDGQESDEWVGMVKRVQTGDIQAERVQPEGQPAVSTADVDAAIADAPQNCTSCGAPITTPIMHGQRQIICEYCGTSMRW